VTNVWHRALPCRQTQVLEHVPKGRGRKGVLIELIETCLLQCAGPSTLASGRSAPHLTAAEWTSAIVEPPLTDEVDHMECGAI
jgi:hypothetical protein